MEKKKDPQSLSCGVWHRNGAMLFKLKEEGTMGVPSRSGGPLKINDVTMLVQVQPYDEKRAEEVAKEIELTLGCHETASLTQVDVREKLAEFLSQNINPDIFKARSDHDAEAVIKNLLWRFIMGVKRKATCRTHRPTTGSGDCSPCSIDCETDDEIFNRY